MVGKYSEAIYKIIDVGTCRYKGKVLYDKRNVLIAHEAAIRFDNAKELSLEEHLELLKNGITFQGEQNV